MPKELTLDQVQRRKEKAERFVRNVLGDDNRAAEIAAEDPEEYAERRGFIITNPRSNQMPTVKELQDRIADLEQENQDLNDQLDAIADIVGGDDDDDDDGDDDDDDDDDSEN